MRGKENPIRIAILCRGYSFENWEAECIRQVLSLPFVEIVLLIAEPQEEKVAKGFFHKLSHYPFRQFHWRFYKRFRIKINSFKQESLEKELKNIPLIFCKPELKGKYSQHFSKEDLEKIKSHQPDVILRFAYNILRGEILTIAKHGVWSYHHADEQIIRGGPAAFWEIYNRSPVTGAILQRLTEKLDAGVILRKGFFQTINHSYKANLEQLIKGTSSWMKQSLIDLANGNSNSEIGKPIQTEAPLFSFPSNFQMVSFKWKLRFNKIKFHWTELFCPEQWNIGIVNQSLDSILDNGISKVNWLPNPKANEYYADPFGWKEMGELKIVFEQYKYKKQKGILAVSNSLGELKPLLESKVHLSYPFVLERADAKENNRVIIPESHQSNTIFCFDSANPKNGKILLENIPAVDSTPLFYNNRWWIFCTKSDNYSNLNLFIYHADEFDGPWLPHQNNPVKSDIRSARPGGTPFIVKGKLYRPAQDCSKTYGGAIVLNEIIELSETSFNEKVISRIEPNRNWKFNKGLHTFSIVDSNTILIDGKRRVFNFDNFRHTLKRKLSCIFRK